MPPAPGEPGEHPSLCPSPELSSGLTWCSEMSALTWSIFWGMGSWSRWIRVVSAHWIQARSSSRSSALATSSESADSSLCWCCFAHVRTCWKHGATVQRGGTCSSSHHPRGHPWSHHQPGTNPAALTSSNLARMMVIQCLMVVMQSGWQAPRMTSPIPTAAFTSTLFSSTFFMNSWKARRNWFVALTPLGFAWAGCFGAPRYLVGVDEGLQGLGVVR